MEFDENNAAEEQDDNYVEIYSKRAIFWFSVLSYPFIGGVLLIQNLRAAGLKKAVYPVLIFSVLYYLISNILIDRYIVYNKIDVTAIKAAMTVFNNKIFILCILSILSNVIGGLILTQYFFKKYFPDDDYYPKSIGTALFITIILMLLLPLIGLGGL